MLEFTLLYINVGVYSFVFSTSNSLNYKKEEFLTHILHGYHEGSNLRPITIPRWLEVIYFVKMNSFYFYFYLFFRFFVTISDLSGCILHSYTMDISYMLLHLCFIYKCHKIYLLSVKYDAKSLVDSEFFGNQ